VTTLKIANIFNTLDGEVSFSGPLHWSTFIRLGGCNLRCWKSSGYCDAPHTLDLSYPYRKMTIAEIQGELIKYLPCKRATITGGEPLLQLDALYELALSLRRLGYLLTLETSGSVYMTLLQMHPFASIIADLKPPSTEMSKMNCDKLFIMLRREDYIKVVLENRQDYDWAVEYLKSIEIIGAIPGVDAPQIAFGPRWGYLEPRVIAEWLREDKLYNIMLNMQLHKYIWSEAITPSTPDLKTIDREKLIQQER
jgi:7-carboxy-7-deazaguanine synthase